MKDNLLKEFEFEEAGRTFFCSVEAPTHAGMPDWWWFRLDGEATTRYAPFAASPRDTRKSVQNRIIAYYAELLAIKARPVHQRPAWTRPERKEVPEALSPAESLSPAS